MSLRRATRASDRDCDDDTIVAAARLNPAAFADLYARYHPAILAFVQGRVADRHLAEDLTSQVFLRALRGLATYDDGSFRGWLYRIARNVVLDSYRGNRTFASTDVLESRVAPEPGPSELIEAQEARAELHRIIDQLAGTQRDIIRLRLQGYTGQEIADVLGLTLGAVKSAQFRAFERIRTLMGPDHHHIPGRADA